jgi:ADP-ribosyl-[dinitrogen reductase] hydrolase
MNASTAATPPLPLRHCYWVVPGLLLAGEHPDGASRDKTKDRLKKLLAAGIECFVDLTKPTELPRYDTLLPFYVEYTRKAIKDHGLPASRDQMIEILELVGNSMRAGRPVYVHCRAGIGRTGTVIGCLLVERGLSGEGALDELNRLWQQSKRSKTWEFVPETEAQTHYIRDWQPAFEAGGFDINPTAAAISAVGPIAAAPDMRPNIAAGKGHKSSKAPGATYAGAGLAAAAAHARATHEASTDSTAHRLEPSVPAPHAPAARVPGDASVLPSAKRAATTPAQPAPPDLPAELAAALASAEAAADRAEAKSATRRSARAPQAPHVPATPSSARGIPDQPAGRGPGPAERPIGRSAPDHPAAPDPAERSVGRGTADHPATGPGPAERSVGRGTADHPATGPGPTERPDSRGPTEHPPDQAPAGRAAAGRVTAGLGTPWLPPEPAPTRAPIDAVSSGMGFETTPEVDPLLDPATLMAARAMRERFVGALLGLATGDAVAAATQYRRPGSFTPVGDMLGGGPFDLPRGAWSDDTAMALCLAESLLECNGFDPRDQVQRYGRWQQEGYLSATGQCLGITANTARSLAMAKWRRVVFPGSHDPEQLDPEPLSRIAPVALYYFASLETTLQQAAESSRTTCQAPAVLEACRVLGRAMHAALSGQPKAAILNDFSSMPPAAAHTNNTAAAALAAGVWAFSSTDNFRDAVLFAVNLGGNSDVVASIAGQLAGAHYGFSAIPPSWRNGLMQKDLIESYADRLLAHTLVALSG